MEKPQVIAGMMAIKQFVLSPTAAARLARRVDHLVLWIDRYGRRSVVCATIDAVHPIVDKLVVIRSYTKWNRWNWRAEMLRSLDKIQPDYVLCPDSDEMFDEGFDVDFAAFRESGADLMMFKARMETEDGREVPLYPKAAHCKAFKWRPGMGYKPYRGLAKPTMPDGIEPTIYQACTQIRHFCFWTREMEQAKVLHR